MTWAIRRNIAKMFKRPRLFHRDRIESDEGFSVSFGRDTLIYREKKCQ